MIEINVQDSPARHCRKILILIVVGVGVRLLYAWLVSPNIISGDAMGWMRVRDALNAGQNPYRQTHFLNWPPLWMQLLFVFSKLSAFTAISFIRILQGFLISVEVVLLIVLYQTFRMLGLGKSAQKYLLIGICLNPICILQVCQQLNFDVMVGLWILLAVVMVLKFNSGGDAIHWLWACCFLGLGALTKTTPFCLTPLLFLSIRRLGWGHRLLGAWLLLGPVALGMSVIYCLAPAEVTRNVIFYRSAAGEFGISGLLQICGAWQSEIVWDQIFELGYFITLVLLTRWMIHCERLAPARIVMIACVLLMAIPALGPGYGAQYIYWFLPLLILWYGLGDRRIRGMILIFVGIAAATALVEFGFMVGFGAVVAALVKTGNMARWRGALSRPKSQTWVRFPLFLAYLMFLAGAWRRKAAD